MSLMRLSPGVYRDSKGNIVQSANGKAATSAPTATKKASKAAPNTFKLPSNINPAYQAQAQYSTEAGNLLNSQIPEVYGQTFNPTDTFDRNAFEDKLFAALTRNVDRDYGREKEQLEQTLANRGIPLDPSDPNYKAHMQYLDEKYQGIKDSARGQAVQMGGAEQQDTFNRQLQTHQQRIGDTGNLADLSGASLGTYGGLYDLQTRRRTADAAMSRIGGGGGGRVSSYASTTQSPFNTGTPPGYGG